MDIESFGVKEGDFIAVKIGPGQGQVLQSLTRAVSDDGCSMRSNMKFRSDIYSQRMQSPEVRGGIHQPFALRRRGGGESAQASDGGLAEMLSRMGMRFL